MKTLIPVLLLVILIIFYCALTFAAPPPNYILKPGNHYFTADWCPACQEQNIIIKQLQDYEIKIHSDPEIFKKLNIKKIPMIIIVKVNEKGRQYYIRLTGVQPIEKLKKILVKIKDE